MSIPNVIVVVAQCSQRPGDTLFGIRVEEMRRGQWEATWAFRVQASAASHEGYDKTKADGQFGLAPGYPGCPTCKDVGFALCGNCHNLGCLSETATYYTCPWCQFSGALGGTIGSLSGGDI